MKLREYIWNGICSSNFAGLNWVKQGVIVSPVSFCIYFDGLLRRLQDSNAGCFIGELSYVDDLTLTSPTPNIPTHGIE